MKVAHVLKDFDVGGIQTLLFDLMRFSIESGRDYLCIGIGEGEMKTSFHKENFRTVFIKKKLPYIDPFTVLKLRKTLLQEKVDVVHAHHTSEGVTAYLATRGTGIRFVQSFHVAPVISNVQDNFVLRFLSKVADVGISPSHSQKILLEENGYKTSKIKVVLNGINPNRLLPQTERDIRPELGIPVNHKLLVSIGNFYNTTRDQLTICKALPRVFNKFPNASFVFFGGHSNRYVKEPVHYLACKNFCEEAGIAGRVFFPGIDTGIGSILQQADLFVYSSLGDTFGMAVVEAMLMGVPVIANDLPVIIEVSGGKGNISVFHTSKPESLATEMEKFFLGEEDFNAKSHKAQVFANTNFHIEQHLKALEEAYLSIL